MATTHRLYTVVGRVGLLLALCCALLLLGPSAYAEQTVSGSTPETSASVAGRIDQLVEESASLDFLDADTLTAAQGDIASLRGALAGLTDTDADFLNTEREKLDRLSAFVEYNLACVAAEANGTLDEMPQDGIENSWRYQNGENVIGEDVALETFNAPVSGDAQYGIDVSYHQGSIDWAAVKGAGVRFAILRCGIGSEWDGVGENKQDDAYWYTNANACRDQGIPFGVYLYSYATNTDMARSEAAHVLRLVKGYDLSLPIFFDQENANTARLDSGTVQEISRVFCDTVKSAGYNVGIYSYTSWFNRYYSGFNWDGLYCWVADYQAANAYGGRYNAWQFSSNGSVSGISGRVDQNYWYGPYAGGSGTVTPTVDVAAATNFVTQLYQVCLDRTPDASGLSNWVAALTSGSQTGSQVASGFVFSREFGAKNYCDEHYVKQLYRAFLGREYDSAGLDYWQAVLQSGKTREEVFNGFVGSQEFTALCASYGIARGNGIAVPAYGTVPTGSCSVDGRQDGVTLFVTRLYKVCLGRAPDADGLRYWTNGLWSHANSGRTAAYGFVFSDEFTAHKYDDTAYVTYLYSAFLDRKPDAAGLADWLSRLANGYTREQVFDGFVGSTEFTAICNRYGIVRG